MAPTLQHESLDSSPEGVVGDVEDLQETASLTKRIVFLKVVV